MTFFAYMNTISLTNFYLNSVKYYFINVWKSNVSYDKVGTPVLITENKSLAYFIRFSVLLTFLTLSIILVVYPTLIFISFLTSE